MIEATLRAALVTPLTGPLSGYGRAGADALALWAEWQREQSSNPVDLTVLDAHPDPIAALQLAQRSRPNVLFGPYGSGPTTAVVRATDRLVWNHGGAQVPPASNLVSILAPADTYFHGVLHAVRQADPQVQAAYLVAGATRFARAVGDGAAAEAAQLGFSVNRSGLLADEPDPAGLGVDPADAILLVVGRFAEELSAAHRFLPRRWRAAGFVGAGVQEVLADLGAGREGLLGPAQWVAEAVSAPDEGPAGARFIDAYRRRTGTDPPYPAAQAFAAGLIAQRCLRDAGSADDAALLAAARKLSCTTLYGRFRLDPGSGRQVGHQVLTVQWHDGKPVVVWPPEQAQAPLRYPLG